MLIFNIYNNRRQEKSNLQVCLCEGKVFIISEDGSAKPCVQVYKRAGAMERLKTQ